MLGSGIIVDIIIFIIIVGNAIFGYRRGLARVIFNICSTIIAIILVFILYKPMTNYVINHTKLAEKIENTIEEKLQNLLQTENVETTEQLQQNEEMASILNRLIGNDIDDTIHNTTNDIIQYVSVEISHKIIGVLVFFTLFTVIRLLLYILKNYVDFIANLPIIRVLNGSGGMVYGIIKGFLLIYVIFVILSLILPIVDNTMIIKAIQNAPIGSKMFEHNIILNLIFKFV